MKLDFTYKKEGRGNWVNLRMNSESVSQCLSIFQLLPIVFFLQVHQETYGKSGCRRIVPGQFLAVDPKGRAILVGAVEKQKLVYIMNRDAAARLTISSPLEAHKSTTVVFSITSIDVGFENPMFACLELDYEVDFSFGCADVSVYLRPCVLLLVDVYC